MENHRKLKKEERTNLFREVIMALNRSKDVKFPIETIKWATTRYINSNREDI